jgi:DNA-binding XRE family transcriptional regulator
MKEIKVDGEIIRMYSFEETFAESFKSKKFVKLFNEEMARLELVHQIKTMRQQYKLTQKALAKRTKMPQSTIARIESGKHSFSLGTLYRIAKAFDKRVVLA